MKKLFLLLALAPFTSQAQDYQDQYHDESQTPIYDDSGNVVNDVYAEDSYSNEYTSYQDSSSLHGQRFYVGGNIGYNDIEYDRGALSKTEENHPFIDLYLGYDLSPNYATEVGFITTNNQKQGSSESKSKAIYADLIAKMKLTQRYNLLASAGLYYSEYDLQVNKQSYNEHFLAPRIGAGAEVKLTEKIKARAIVKYAISDLELNSNINNELQYSIGLNYHF